MFNEGCEGVDNTEAEGREDEQRCRPRHLLCSSSGMSRRGRNIRLHHRQCESIVSRGLSKSRMSENLMLRFQSCQIVGKNNNIRICLPR